MVPWLHELTHLPTASLKRLTRAIPTTQAKIENLIAVVPSSDEDSDDGSDDDHMEAVNTPKRPSTATSAKVSSVALIKVDPGVSVFHQRFPVFY